MASVKKTGGSQEMAAPELLLLPTYVPSQPSATCISKLFHTSYLERATQFLQLGCF